MTVPFIRRALVAATLLPLALGLAACGKKDDAGTGAAAGAPIAAVAPPAGKTWSDVIAPTPDGGYRMGNPGAAIKVVEYGSLTCPHCAEFAKESNEQLAPFVDSGRVSFEFRNFVRDAIDMTAALVTRCGPPESYFALTHAAFANQTAMFDKIKAAGDPAFKAAVEQPDAKRFPALAQLTGLDEFAASHGIAKDKAAVCLADSATASTLAKGTETATKDKGIDATPTLFVNDEKLDTPLWSDLKAKLENMGAR
jgi:protein-disulfide isomerase